MEQWRHELALWRNWWKIIFKEHTKLVQSSLPNRSSWSRDGTFPSVPKKQIIY